MNYKIGRNGQEIGEWSLEEIRLKYRQGELLATDLAWTQGMGNWVLLSQVLNTTPDFVPGTTPPPPPAGDINTINQQILETKPARPNSNLVWAILVTIFCCWPLGIPAIVYAAKVDSAYSAGEYERSLEMARKAKKWIWIAVASGFLVAVIYVLLAFFGVIAGSLGV